MSVPITADTVREWGRRYSNWGRWGPDDELGALNFITPERVLAATALPRRGRVVSCALNFDHRGPQTGSGGRHNPIHVMLADGGDALAGYYDGKMYNDRDIALITSRGARKNGIDAVKQGVVGRGVLLDLPRHRGELWLEGGEAIGPAELDACAEAQGIAVESGDIVLVRTGMMTRCLGEGSWEGYCGGAAPGLSIHCAAWLYEREVAAICTDTWGVEVQPNETVDCFQPLHMISLRNTGVLFGEIFHLDDLAEACAEDERYAFLFTAPPLPITGAVGSPINPLAIL
jgi:kynurenine formamidase